MLANMWQSRELVINLVKRDVKTRYKESVLGIFWSFMKPLLLMVILNLVFSTFVRIPLTNSAIPFGLHLLVALLPWIFFTGALSEGTSSILANGALIKKVNVPNAVFPLSSILSNLFHFVMALVVLAAFMVYYQVKPTMWILLLPMIVLLQFVFVFGLSLLTSALNVFYRDISSIVEVLLIAWFYLSPIIYPVYKVSELKGDTWLNLYMLNPMATMIVCYRRLLLYPAFNDREIPDKKLLVYLGITAIVSIATYLIGWRVFNHCSKQFADEV